MKCPRIIPFLRPGLAIGAKRHEGFANAWNWLIHSFWHMKLGDGLKWKDKWQGYPEIHLAIEAGEGIDVKYGNGKIIISAGDGNTEESNYATSGGGTVPGDAETGNDEPGELDGIEHADGEISGGGGQGDGDSGSSGGISGETGGGESGASGETGGQGTDCNDFSEDDIDNGDDDPGLYNPGDECAILNGW